MNNSSGYEVLISKLNEFIRKYYKNQIIKGILYSVAILLAFYLLLIGLEYFGNFNSAIRTVIFWSYVLTAGFILIRYVFIPLFKLFRLGKTISHKQASTIIGNHFPTVKDKLLNTLQLKELANNDTDNSLINASINQKIDELKPVPFTSAVDFKENTKYLKYVIPPVMVFLIILFTNTAILKEPTERIIKFNEEIERVAPYQIKITNDELAVPKNDDYELTVELSGEVIPDKLYLVLNGQQYRMQHGANNTYFGHVFHNVQKDVDFKFYGDGFYSKDYLLKTIPTPALVNFDVNIDYPGYTGFKDEVLANTGDLTIPEGSILQWNFKTENTDRMQVKFADTTYVLVSKGNEVYTLSKRVWDNDVYSIHPENDLVNKKDSILYQINIIPDNRPSIKVVEEKDSLNKKELFFSGEVQDDYGFSRLTFNYTFEYSDEKPTNKRKSISIPVSRSSVSDQFFYHWSLDSIGISPGDKIAYYFEIWDNDGVHGAKATRSQMNTFDMPSLDEIKDERDQQNDELKDEMEKSIDDAKKLQEELKELKKEFLQKEKLDWQDKKKLEELLKKQKQLQNQVENIQKQNEQKNKEMSEYEPPNENILEKQQKLQELMDQVMTPEMKKLYEEMEKLMEKMDMDQIQKQMEKMDLSNEDIEKELDRAMEQFKQLEWEQKMDENINKLKELAKKQEELSEKSKDKNADKEELQKEQEKLNKEFEKLQEEMKEAEKLNEELEDPNPMPDTEQMQEDIKKDQQESSESLSKNKKEKASKSQKDAASKMDQMAQQMEMMMSSASAEQQEEDMDALRALLENIITMSFDQEDLMAKMKKVDKNDPKYVSYGQTQFKLKDDSKMVADSLFALSKRIPQLSAFVNKEIGTVNEYMDKALEDYGEQRTPQIVTSQQYVMTSFNNLALMLDDALKQMQKEQNACKKPGSGSCNKPGGQGKKPSASKMKAQQESLEKQLQNMKKKLENFNKGENKQGKGMGGMSQELMQMAAKQAAIRQQIEQMSQELNEDGSGKGNGLKQIAKEMEEMEKDIVNKDINTETLKRQQDIMTRLLKAENAEREREQDKKRKSTEAREQKVSNPVRYTEYQKLKEKEVEMLRTMPPSLKPYYKEKVNKYFNKLGAE